MGIAQLSGRDFGNETANAPKVAIVNQSFVKQFFGDRNAIGQRVTGTGATYEIVGVVKDSRSRTLGEDSRPILYRSLAQDIGRDPDFRGVSLVVETQGNAAAMEAAVRNQVHALDPAMAIFNAETMEEHLRDALVLPRLAGTLFGVFGITGLILTVLGLYGITTYSVSRRTREIGIRLALGAQISSVQRLVARQYLFLAFIAIALGRAVRFGPVKICCEYSLWRAVPTMLSPLRPSRFFWQRLRCWLAGYQFGESPGLIPRRLCANE